MSNVTIIPSVVHFTDKPVNSTESKYSQLSGLGVGGTFKTWQEPETAHEKFLSSSVPSPSPNCERYILHKTNTVILKTPVISL